MSRPQFIVVGLALLMAVISTVLGFLPRILPNPRARPEPTLLVATELMEDWSLARTDAVPPTPTQEDSASHLATDVSPHDSPSPMPSLSLEGLDANDLKILEGLPPSCTAGIPGLQRDYAIPDHSQFTAPAPPPEVSKVGPAGDASDRPLDTSMTPSAVVATSATELDTPIPVASSSPQTPSGILQPIQQVSFENDLPPQDQPATQPGLDPHAEVFANSLYPSAVECAKCHQQIYDEWASSSHAYASISPMFQRFEDTISKLTQGTIGYFCMRCHAPVATTMSHPRDAAIYDGPKVFREGVTCVACHRVREAYTKSNGERRIEPGDVYAPVYGSSDGSGNALAIQYKDLFKIKTSPDDSAASQPIHACSIQFEQLSQSDFCMSCHQVAVPPGIKLEVVWDQYRASPAYKAGVTCQDCHMGKVPGVQSGYTTGPAAVVSDRVVNPHRKHSHHAFYGPGSTIAHPGLFPHDSRADRWTPDQWLEFDWRAGWGRDDFERPIASGEWAPNFPPPWQNADDRYDAREIVDANIKRIQIKNDLRRQVMENGSKIDGPFFEGTPQAGKTLEFEYCVTNLNPGHNMPSGSLGAQPQLWLNVVLIAPDGQRVWESGYLDSVGDLADIHSEDVLCGRLPLDRQLFNLQTKFLTTNVKGTDREMPLPINFDIDQLPFIRPAAQPVTVINHPPLIRMEAHSLPPLGSRRAKYRVPASVIRGPGLYRLSVRLRSRLEPIYFMRFCGATPEMLRSMNETILDVHPYSVVFQVQ